MEKRDSEIGDPSQWRVKQILLTNENTRVQLEHKTGDRSLIGFNFPRSENLSAEERMAFRQYANQACAEAGFEPYKPRETPLPSGVIEGVRRGDPDAWATYVDKHKRHFIKNADRFLGNGNNPTLLDSEDFVSKALEKVFRESRNKTLESHPQDRINYRIFSEVKNHVNNAPFKLRKESDNGDFERIVQPEYDGQVETTAEQLPIILEEARKLITPRQREVLEAITANEERGSELTGPEIAKTLNMSKQAFYIHIKKIASAIQQAANMPEFEETATQINGLVRINERDQSPGAVASRLVSFLKNEQSR